MSRTYSLLLVLLGVLLAPAAWAQYQGYRYQRPIEGLSSDWHRLPLPQEIFKRLQPDMADLRIIGIQAGGDTLEAPYLLQVYEQELKQLEVPFELLNQSHGAAGYQYTFRLPQGKEANQLSLRLKEDNFDWRAKVEGSHDQQQWHTLAEDQRLVAIKNAVTDYRFTSLHFPKTNYRYLRLSVQAEEQPTLLSASMRVLDTLAGKYARYDPLQVEVATIKKEQQTQLRVQLPQAVPVSRLELLVQDAVDYYRPITLQYVADSFQTSKGWQYQYKTIGRYILSSVEDKSFEFPYVIARDFRLLVDNYDSPPLRLDVAAIKGPEVALIARFTEPAEYALLYGQARARQPVYDVEWFRNKIPDAPQAAVLGPEEGWRAATTASAAPLFKNKLWLWAAMGAIMLLLGWFTLSMFKKEHA